MPDTKISNLASGAPGQLADELPLRRGANNVKLTVQDVLAALGLLPAVTPALLTDVLATIRSGAGKTLTVADLLPLTERRNMIINGAFEVAERASTYALTTVAAWGLDRWFAFQATAAGCTASIVAPSPALPGFSKCLKILLTAAAANKVTVGQIVETIDVTKWQGRNVTLHIRAVKGSSWNPTNVGVLITTGTGTDQGLASLVAATWTGQANTVNSNFVPTAAWVDYPFNFTVPAGCTEIAVQMTATPSGAAVDANSYLMVTGVEVKEGLAADNYHFRPYREEEMLCQRFFCRAAGSGSAATAAIVDVQLMFPVVMRVAPAITAPQAIRVWDGSLGAITQSSALAAYSITSNQRGGVCRIGNLSGATIARPYQQDATTPFAFDAELI
jgi:hypothetical protein